MRAIPITLLKKGLALYTHKKVMMMLCILNGLNVTHEIMMEMRVTTLGFTRIVLLKRSSSIDSTTRSTVKRVESTYPGRQHCR